MNVEEVIEKIKSLYDKIEDVDIEAKDYILNQLAEIAGCNIHDAYIMGFKHGMEYESKVIKNAIFNYEAQLKSIESE